MMCRCCGIALALVLLVTMSSMTVFGDVDDEYKVLIVAAETPTARDDTLDAEVHVFRRCEHFDVPVEDIVVRISPDGEYKDSREVPVSKVRDGVYKVEAQMAEDDWSERLSTDVDVVVTNISGTGHEVSDLSYESQG